jgi:hypothetical protein
MPEQSKFSGALAKLNQPKQPVAEQTPKQAAKQVVERKPDKAQNKAQNKAQGAELSTASVGSNNALKTKGRPPGKRSNPNYEPTTVLLQKNTKKLANRKLEDEETGQDLSDLIEQLLSRWIKT